MANSLVFLHALLDCGRVEVELEQVRPWVSLTRVFNRDHNSQQFSN